MILKNINKIWYILKDTKKYRVYYTINIFYAFFICLTFFQKGEKQCINKKAVFSYNLINKSRGNENLTLKKLKRINRGEY